MKKRSNDRFEFTIIAGELKGRRINAPNLGHTRPPLSRLRKSIFDFLKPYLPGASYLDLFSGTGSYLFEAVSRGVTSALGVESETKMVEAIMRWADKYDVADRLQCREEDVFEAIPKLESFGRLFDIVMIAPPQYQGMVDRTLECLKAHPIVAPSGLLLCQHDTLETRDIDFLDFTIEQQRKYGNTTFTVLRLQP
ncbi:MAG: RsmD family RNA methyltransferase [candidate division Zixibacteria bacterium]|nr:RsmD family RNA methyltransferase [candidate division Zixibacteria bacterium]MDH3938042.1 RsmD family RNA methyltransferase [candidate division Zixibacteria bacterium]MDH4033866.1 RsmD family RNA methyltransferase [candidate division Zixibacteria bacterium]